MYPYGPGRDQETPKMDDGSSAEVVLLLPFVFFNAPYRSIYVSPPLLHRVCIKELITYYTVCIGDPILLRAGQQ